MAETYYDAIRNFSEDEMAAFICNTANLGIPLRYDCDVLSCFDCPNDLICYKNWLRKEVKIVETKHNDTE